MRLTTRRGGMNEGWHGGKSLQKWMLLINVLGWGAIVLFQGCEPKGDTDKITQEVTRESAVAVESDDTEMELAMQQAREHFPDFWKAWTEDSKRPKPLLTSAMIKAYFFDPDDPDGGEHMWLTDIAYDGEHISGVLMDTPEHIGLVRVGERVSLPGELLSDWICVKDGKAVGGYTVKLLRSRMTVEERMEHDSHYSFKFE